jgi:hypothetical protein
MKYWDSSAIIPLLIREESTDRMKRVATDDPAIATWWGSTVECVSALCRLERDAHLSVADLRDAVRRLTHASASWTEVSATSTVRDQAIRLLRVHRLRAADALQLGAAIVASDFTPESLEFVTLDDRQADAADREGFRLS